MRLYIAYMEEKEPGKHICCVGSITENTELASYFSGMKRAHFFTSYEEAEKEAREWLAMLPDDRKYKVKEDEIL